MAKEACNLAIAEDTISAGDSFVVILADDGGIPLAGKNVHIELTKDGFIVDEDVVTDSDGKAKLMVNETGEYSVDCKFDGDANYSAASVDGKINVSNAKTEVIGEDKADSSSNSGLSEDGYSYYPEYGPAVDSAGVTREEAISKNMHYIEMRVDGDAPGEYVTVGGYVAYDPVAGCYHT